MSQNIIQHTIQFVQEQLADDSSGHDWYHIQRVWHNAQTIHDKEQKGNRLVVELAALLHDLADEKLFNEIEGLNRIQYFLEGEGIAENIIQHVLEVIQSISYRKGDLPLSTEGKIVQDADRLDAIGAIGIARAFAYGGHNGRKLYDPHIPPKEYIDHKADEKEKSPTINHFYEKLLRLQDLMKTETGRKLAQSRHEFMIDYLEQFYSEINDESIELE